MTRKALAFAFSAISTISAPLVAGTTQGPEASIVIAEPEAPVVRPWQELKPYERHLTIMGIIDGFSAAEMKEQPCFPGMSNEDIARKIDGDSPGISSSPSDVAAAIKATASSCPSTDRRPYPADMFRTIPAEHADLYMAGLIAGWNASGACQTEIRIANAEFRAKFLADTSDNNPVAAARKALRDICAGDTN